MNTMTTPPTPKTRLEKKKSTKKKTSPKPSKYTRKGDRKPKKPSTKPKPKPKTKRVYKRKVNTLIDYTNKSPSPKQPKRRIRKSS